MQLGRNKIEILQALAQGKSPTVSSPQRRRLELMGLVTDSVIDLVLTPAGRIARRHRYADSPRSVREAQPPRDAAGRKRMLDRVVRGM